MRDELQKVDSLCFNECNIGIDKEKNLKDNGRMFEGRVQAIDHDVLFLVKSNGNDIVKFSQDIRHKKTIVEMVF